MLATLSPRGFAPLLEDLGLAAGQVCAADPLPPQPPRTPLAGVAAGVHDPQALTAELGALGRNLTDARDTLLLFLDGAREDAELARWRDALWPALHLVATYRLTHGGMQRRTLQGESLLAHGSGHRGDLLVLKPRAAVFARDAVAAKFDLNAAGWNGEPGRPGYAHFRWMRRFVGTFADARGKRRILDFGCGAGWVGIEAAQVAREAEGAREAELCFFDPSPEMVARATANAAAEGLQRCTGRVGFGEEPPFPAAGEAPFDLVLSSGVISFSGEPERFLDGLVAALAPGGTLVIGDLNPGSRGMLRRRRTRPLLPLRELNAPARETVERGLVARGLTLEAWAGYQLTDPVPRLMHLSAQRLAGLLDPLLLFWNRRRAGPGDPQAFDSWVVRARR